MRESEPSAADVSAPADRTTATANGTLWRLTAEGRQLDADLVRPAPGARFPARASRAESDVLLYVVAGGGELATRPAGPARPLVPGSVVRLPRGTRDAPTAGPGGLTVLTARRRGPLPALPRVPAEGGEPACLLHRVCPACGRLAAEPAADVHYCARCGAPLPES